MEETRKPGKKLVIISSSIVTVLVLLFVGYFYLTGSSLVPAQVHVESGEVLVNDKIVKGNVKLSERDVIETKGNSLATVFLYESIVINLEPDTLISIEELAKAHPEISQQKGGTWNTFTKLFGIESHTIKTGNSVASVRATAFGFKENYILGGYGSVSYQIDGREFLVLSKKVVEKTDGEIIERDATQEEVQKIIQEMDRTLKELEYLREKEIEKKPFLKSMVKWKTGFSDEELQSYLRDIDDGKLNVDDLVKQIPFEIKSIDKIVEITKNIQDIKRRIRDF